MKKQLLSIFSGFDATLSLPRIWMGGFGLAVLVASGIVLRHLLRVTDPAVLAAWKDILVTVAPWTLSICALPFSVSKITGRWKVSSQAWPGENVENSRMEKKWIGMCLQCANDIFEGELIPGTNTHNCEPRRILEYERARGV
jgi:hypothetical protein